MEPVSNGSRPGRRWALGAILALAGLWGAVAPFVITSGQSGKHGGAKQASERLAVNIAPGVAGALAGLVLVFLALRSSDRLRGPVLAAGVLALVAGVWFVVGPAVWSTIHTVVRTTPAKHPPHPPTISKGRKLTVLLADSFGPGLVVTALAGAALAARRRPKAPKVPEAPTVPEAPPAPAAPAT